MKSIYLVFSIHHGPLGESGLSPAFHGLFVSFAPVTTFLLLSSVSSSVKRIQTLGLGIRHPPRKGKGFARSWDSTGRAGGLRQVTAFAIAALSLCCPSGGQAGDLNKRRGKKSLLIHVLSLELQNAVFSTSKTPCLEGRKNNPLWV